MDIMERGRRSQLFPRLKKAFVPPRACPRAASRRAVAFRREHAGGSGTWWISL